MRRTLPEKVLSSVLIVCELIADSAHAPAKRRFLRVCLRAAVGWLVALEALQATPSRPAPPPFLSCCFSRTRLISSMSCISLFESCSTAACSHSFCKESPTTRLIRIATSYNEVYFTIRSDQVCTVRYLLETPRHARVLTTFPVGCDPLMPADVVTHFRDAMRASSRHVINLMFSSARMWRNWLLIKKSKSRCLQAEPQVERSLVAARSSSSSKPG